MDFNAAPVILVWLIAAPLSLFGLLALAAFLEHRVVAPVERARRIGVVLSKATPDEVEQEVARLLRSVDRPRRAG